MAVQPPLNSTKENSFIVFIDAYLQEKSVKPAWAAGSEF